LGVDGSGKTTVAKHIEQHLRAENHTVHCVWATLRPVIGWPIIKIAKFLFVRKHSKFDNYAEHIKVKREGIRRFRFLLKPLFYLSFVDYYPQYLWKIVWMGMKSDDLICDRYYVDMLMERAIMHGIRPEYFPDWIQRYGRFFRTPDLVLYLRTSPEVAMKRKTDIPSEEYLRERTLYYDSVTKVLRAHIIDGDQPLPVVLAQAQECINDFDRVHGAFTSQRLAA
jgi:thymidylate kinase